MTESEIANYSTVIEEAETALAELDAVRTSLKKKLAALGLSADELTALIGA